MIKIILFACLGILIYLMSKQIVLGIKTRNNIHHLKNKTQPFTAHKRNGRMIFFFMLASVLAIECMVRIKGGLVKIDDLFFFHISTACIFFVLTFLLNWPFNGKRSKHHKEMAYYSVAFFLGMVGTAIPIILRLK